MTPGDPLGGSLLPESGILGYARTVFWPLTRRRAVDLCRVGSCLCRTS